MGDKKKEASREVLHRYYRAQIRNVDPDNFTVDALVSDGTVDRHGTIIQPEAWKKDLKYYKDHPVLLASHNHGNLLSQIGEAKVVKVTDDGLETRFVYYAGEGNQQADWAWNLVMHGMAMFSVGFIAHEQERPEYKDGKVMDPLKDPYMVYTRVELAEVSQVTVGSNRNALQRAIDGAFDDKDGQDPDVAMLAELAADITESMKLGELEEMPELASPEPGGDKKGVGEEVPPNPAPAPPGNEYKGFDLEEDSERPSGSLEDATGKGVTVEIKATEIQELKEVVDEVKDLLTKLNDKLELFTPEELRALLGRKDAEVGADEAHKAPDTATAILEKDKGGGEGQPSGLASIIAQAEKVTANLKG